VYYRYFADSPEPARRVASRDEAIEAIEDCLATLRKGGTDLEAALITSLQEIGRARASDETLRRAHVVLVTDGIARVDAARVWAERARLGDVSVGLSVIAVGSENEALRSLAAAQRRAGQEVFYHYFSEAVLRELLDPRTPRTTPRSPSPSVAPAPVSAGTEPAQAPTVAAQPGATQSEPLPSPEAGAPEDEAQRWRELERLVDELLALRTEVELGDVEASRFHAESLAEVGLSLERDLSEGERARHECLRREDVCLQRRYERWFPAELRRGDLDAGGEPTSPGGGDEPTGELLATLEIILGSVAEVLDVLDGPALQRRYDAVEIVERLLLEAGIPPWRYLRTLPSLSERGRESLAAIRSAVDARSPQSKS
jgi:hypothetical protein